MKSFTAGKKVLCALSVMVAVFAATSVSAEELDAVGLRMCLRTETPTDLKRLENDLVMVVYPCRLSGRDISVGVAYPMELPPGSDLDSRSAAELPEEPEELALVTEDPRRIYDPQQALSDVKYLLFASAVWWGTNPNFRGECEHMFQGSPFAYPLHPEEYVPYEERRIAEIWAEKPVPQAKERKEKGKGVLEDTELWALYIAENGTLPLNGFRDSRWKAPVSGSFEQYGADERMEKEAEYFQKPRR